VWVNRGARLDERDWKGKNGPAFYRGVAWLTKLLLRIVSSGKETYYLKIGGSNLSSWGLGERPNISRKRRRFLKNRKGITDERRKGGKNLKDEDNKIGGKFLGPYGMLEVGSRQ